MDEVTLGDYAGYLVPEMLKARQEVDRYSRAVAEQYAQDPIMRFFSVPRFRMPKIELSVPVVVSDARVIRQARFDYPVEAFTTALSSTVDELVEVLDPQARRRSQDVVRNLVPRLHARLLSNPDPSLPEAVVRDAWPPLLEECLQELGVPDRARQSDQARAAIDRSVRDVVELVRSRTVIDRTDIDSLLVDPRTDAVKAHGDGDGGSVFTMRMEVLEEGFFMRSLRDEETGRTTSVVEFE